MGVVLEAAVVFDDGFGVRACGVVAAGSVSSERDMRWMGWMRVDGER